MGIPALILGESGTGKSTSIRTLPAEQTALIQIVKKPLPFKKGDFKPVHTDDWNQLIKWIHSAAKKGKSIIVIDDFQYLMANEFMRAHDKKGFDKFTDIAYHAWSVIQTIQQLPDNVRVYFLSHTATDENGTTKIKTIGKLLDEKITVEGLFTIVLRTARTDAGYFFTTQNNGFDTVKSPMGMFEDQMIDNDLNAVDQAIIEFYDINTTQEKAA